MPAVTPLSEREVMTAGLVWAGFDVGKQQRTKLATNDCRFRAFYGSGPKVVAKLYADLIVGNATLKIHNLLMALYLLKCYPTEPEICGKFKVSEKTARESSWRTIAMIQALKHGKVSASIATLLYDCLLTNITLCLDQFGKNKSKCQR